jgi:serine/threonine-protein kinase RsbW
MSETVTLAMPAKSEYLILARLALAGIAREVPMSESVLADLKLAVTEACGNAVRHAYASDHGVVHVRFRIESEQIEVEVVDQGVGRTDGRIVPPPTPPTDDIPAESGMGLAIIDAVVDELEIEEPAGDAGTVLRMRKRLHPV